MTTKKERKRRTDLSPLEHRRLKGGGGLTMALGKKMSILVWILMGSILFDNLLSSESSKSAHPILAERSRKVPPFTLLPRAMAFNLWHNIEKLEQQATSKRSITTTTTPIIMPPQPTTRRNNEDEALSKNFDEASSSWPPQEMRNEDDEEDIMENSSSSINPKKNEALLSQPSTESFLSFLSSLHKDGNEHHSEEQPKTTPTNTDGDDDIRSTFDIADDKVGIQKEQEQTDRNQQEQDAEVSDTTRDDESDKEDNLVVASFVARKKICTKPLPLAFLNTQKNVESVDDPTTLFLKEFFLKHRNLLFADGATIREINEPSDSLLKVFDEEQEQHKQRRRQNNSKEDLMLMDQEANPSTKVITKFLVLSNPPMGFLGLQLISKVIVATQLFCFLNEQKSSTTQKRLPEYQFTLVGSSFDARGPKPLVWVFNKIMKRGDNNNGSTTNKNKKDVENATKSNGKKKKAMKTSGFTRVWAEEVSSTFSDGSTLDTDNEITTGEGDDRTAKMHRKNTSHLLPMSSHNKIDMIGGTTKKKNGNNSNDEASSTSSNPKNMIRFCTDATLVSDLVFPKLLVRILPVTLEKMEEEGSKAMQGAVEKDIIPAMERIQNAWYNCTVEQN